MINEPEEDAPSWTAEIIPFPGSSLPLHIASEPDQEVIMFIEEVLDRAKRGEIRAIGVAYASPGSNATTGFTYGSTNGYHHQLVSAVTKLGYRLQASGDDDF